eukprot:TRINITY_DN102903_c0_g1_i1.p1 TRINITY_DN102903_c0_g1~~TRINITY_DN102903_c0_g1_i1.p1  ORF type:complete len:601 (-),score=109.48 TRINITY_DN102903_c0_g1_i1:82-1884(-)
MIRFRQGTWHALFYWWGGVNRKIITAGIGYFVVVTMMYYFEITFHTYMSTSDQAIHAMAGFVVFLLVFRLNQCMGRYNNAEAAAGKLFARMQGLTSILLLNMRGPDGVPLPADGRWSEKEKTMATEYTELSIVVKLNCIRLSLATVIAFLMHSRLLNAAKDALGDLEDDVMIQVMYFYVRLQGLLYPAEMEIIDNALLVTWHRNGKYRAECCRHLPEAMIGGETVIGKHGSEDGRTVASLPQATLNLLLLAMRQALDKPWGFPERVLNTVADAAQEVRYRMSELETVVAQPLPLAYIQHCHSLLVMFALCYPLSIDPESGLMNNIVMPVSIFWAMLGIEMISSLLENPMGDDETDLNLLEQVHILEANAKFSFDISERHSMDLKKNLWQPLDDFGMGARHERTQVQEEPPGKSPLRTFETYFTWVDMPHHLLEWLLMNHGRVGEVHEAHWRHGLSRLRARLELALSKASEKMQTTHGNAYLKVGQSPNCAQDESDEEYSAWISNLMNIVKQDPSNFCHHLVFNGATMHNVQQQQQASPADDSEKTRGRAALMRRLTHRVAVYGDQTLKSTAFENDRRAAHRLSREETGELQTLSQRSGFA